ncbi:MAG: YceD family protein [Anaerolineales bacterium]
MSNYNNPFRLNVGFLIHQPVGSSRDFIFEVPNVNLDPDLELEDLTGSARVTRAAQGLLVHVKLQALLHTECVRCLSEFRQPLSTDFTELYAFSRKSITDSELILPEDAHINLRPLIREYMLLDIPIKPLCSPDCKGLCLICGENLNEGVHDHSPEPIDPRLSILKSLLDEQN